MQAKSLAIGVFAYDIGGYYFGAMLSGIHQVTRAAGVPLLVMQGGIEELPFPPFGAEHVAGWIALHPAESATARLAALLASGVPLVTVPTAPEGLAYSSVVVENRGDTCALVSHLFRQLRMAMTRARLGYEAAKNQFLTTVNRTNHYLNLAADAQRQSWLHSLNCAGIAYATRKQARGQPLKRLKRAKGSYPRAEAPGVYALFF